ncbi:MAG: SGNH/GDSL hydrolase family protein [Alphaproteobacteria bacterium]
MTRLAARALGAVIALLLAASAAPVGAGGAEPACPTPPTLLSIKPALTYVAAKLAKRERLTILAMGSSSTEGVGASSPAASYPSRLEAELRRRFPGVDIRVINRGRGGEDAPEGVVRLERHVVADDPDLVIWQIGTNAALRGIDPAVQRAVLRRGIALVKESAADVVLMDLQYAPRVLASPAHETMEKLIAEVAERNRVGLFRRFEIMRHWFVAAPSETAPAISADGLHMTDRSYACLAAGMAEAIARNWRQYHAERSPATFAWRPGAADSDAGREP